MSPLIHLGRAVAAACAASLLVVPASSAETTPDRSSRGTASHVEVLITTSLDEGTSMLVHAKVRILPRQRGELMLLQARGADGEWVNIDNRGTNQRGIAKMVGRVGEGVFAIRVASPGGRGKLRVSESWSIDNSAPEPDPDKDYSDEEGVRAALQSINDTRAEHGLHPVVLDIHHSQAAQEQAVDLASGTEVRYIGEYLYENGDHPEYPRDVWKAFDGCYGFSEDPATWDLNTERFLDPAWESVMIGFTERLPGANSSHGSGRWAVSMYMFERDHDAMN